MAVHSGCSAGVVPPSSCMAHAASIVQHRAVLGTLSIPKTHQSTKQTNLAQNQCSRSHPCGTLGPTRRADRYQSGLWEMHLLLGDWWGRGTGHVVP